MPTVRGMAAEGNFYGGFLYAGLMIPPDGTPKVLEYNCRFGDPETQPIMMRLKSGITALCDAVVTNSGRVLCVTALGDTVAEARRRAYEVCATIRWDGSFYRRDIGHRAIARERERRTL